MELPHDLDAEAAVLGGILIDPDALTDVMDILKPADFYSGENGRIFQTMMALRRDNKPIDMMTMITVLKARKVAAPEDMLLTLLNAVPTSINTRTYGEIVRSASTRRHLIAAAGEIATIAYDGGRGIDAVMDAAQKRVMDITDAYTRRNMAPIRDVLLEVYDETLAAYSAGGLATVGIPTGLVDIDKIINGLEPGRLYYLAARPAMGKSALAATMQVEQAKRGHAVAVFSLEMSRKQVMHRYLANLSKLSTDMIRHGRLNESQWATYGKAHGVLANVKLHIDDTAGLTVPMLSASCHRLKMTGKLDIVYVDYVQLMESDVGGDNMNTKMSYISRSLKKLAKELDVPVVALSQLSRGLEARRDKHPMLSDLRDSGALEQDGDVIMFLYREAYYESDCAEPSIAEVTVSKNRDGKTGTARLYWDDRLATFRNLTGGAS